jgi:hypothetical protein
MGVVGIFLGCLPTKRRLLGAKWGVLPTCFEMLVYPEYFSKEQDLRFAGLGRPSPSGIGDVD